jgi:hypothetical protein
MCQRVQFVFKVAESTTFTVLQFQCADALCGGSGLHWSPVTMCQRVQLLPQVAV